MNKLLLLIDTRFYYDREILKGIKAKIDEYQLKLTIAIESIEHADEILSEQWDYVIADFDKGDRHRIIPRLNSNVLIYSSYAIEHPPESVSTLVNDNEQFACLALGQFLQNDIHNVAFYMEPRECNAGWANERKQTFDNHANRLEFKYFENVKEAIASRQFPLGVYCASDRSARKLVNFCTERNIAVPTQVSIIGTDCDDAERSISPLPLSSVNHDPYMLGQRCMDVLLKAKRFKRVLHEKFQPASLMNKKSTQEEINQDHIVNKALYYLHNNFHFNIKVQQVLDYCRVSRKTLDNRFIKCKGVSVHQYLATLRILKSKKLLRNSKDSIESIALQCGYPNQSYLYQIYRKQFDYTPCEYRQGLNAM
ncbi:helix-turn-helix domain-containing protein [Psychromonas sp. MME1]|uniref:AraC family transcriptional regulator n=1 Tax=Psychromonas sp. MME1 TaxID=3231032 RepID=UPI0034E19743